MEEEKHLNIGIFNVKAKQREPPNKRSLNTLESFVADKTPQTHTHIHPKWLRLSKVSYLVLMRAE